MRSSVAIALLLLADAAVGDTKQEVIVNCDKLRDNPVSCTACNIYHESRSEPLAGQLAVGLVTLNRLRSPLYPSTMCEVVWEVRRDARTHRRVPMFSWTRDGRHDKVYNKRRWELAQQLAHVVVNAIERDHIHDFTLGALWYHRIDISPYWKSAYHPTIRIGVHQFYVAKEEQFLHALVESMISTTVLEPITPEDTVDEH